MWNLKKDTNELVCKIGTDLQTWKTNLWLPKGEAGGRDKLGIWDWQIYTTIYKINKDLLYSI